MKIKIYTAIFGSYDDLVEQPSYPGVDYVCFTDNANLKSDSWKIVHVVSPRNEHPRITAKRFKTAPHKYLNADFTIWIDGNLRPKIENFVDISIASIKKYGIGLMKHPMGKCILQDAIGSYPYEQYKGQRMLEQVEHYFSLGYPRNNGLACGGIIARDMHNPVVKKVGEDWLEENLKWTFQDQLSLPYVLWKNKWWFNELPYQSQRGVTYDYFEHKRKS